MGLFSFRKPICLKTCDIHNHLLPGVDDGFRQPRESLAAIRRLADAGVREITFTPHMNPDVYPEENEAHFKEVYDAFAESIPQEWGVKTALASEYMVVKDFHKRPAKDELLAFPDRSILIEMSYYFRSENLEESVFALTSEGYKPILAHPERYLYMVECLEDFDRIRDMGCRFQLNWMSLTGVYGDASLKILKHLLSRGMYSFVATDLHTLHQLEAILSIKLPQKTLKLLEQI